MLKAIKESAKEFIKKTEFKKIRVISHNDSDGITSAAIITKALQRLGRKFSLIIVKQLEEEFIRTLPEEEIILFLDLASNSFNYIKKLKTEVFILDHHEIISEIPENVTIINPHLFNEEEISGAGISYLFARELNDENKDLAYLAVIGMVGDMLEKNLGKILQGILNDSKVIVKKGLTLYPATRPLNKVLEYNSDVYIPGVTGSNQGTKEFLRENGIGRIGGQFKSIIELDKEEMSKLITAITLQATNKNGASDLIGNIYLINIFNKLEDVRQVSAMLNACSRLGESGIAIAYALQNKKAKESAEVIYAKYKQSLVNALDSLPKLKKIKIT